MGTDPSRVVMSGPLTPFAAGFAGGLAGRGHAPGVVAVHLRLMAHLSRWLEARALGPADLGPSAVGAFVAARRAAGCSSGRTAGSLAPLLGYLRAAGAAPVPQAAAAQGPVDVLLAGMAPTSRGTAAWPGPPSSGTPSWSARSLTAWCETASWTWED